MTYVLMTALLLVFFLMIWGLIMCCRKVTFNGNAWLNYGWYGLVFVVMFLLWLSTVKKYVMEPFRVSSVSMEDNLFEGDIVLANKLALKMEGLKRGKIYVFRDHVGKLTIKRCIGIPGDTISISAGEVYINGHREELPVTAKWRYQLLLSNSRGFVRFIDSLGIKEVKQSESFLGNGFEATLTTQGKADINTFHGLAEITKKPNNTMPESHYPQMLTANLDSMGELVVPSLPLSQHDYGFFLGDNRDSSVDSRWLGLISTDDIIGCVELVLPQR